eukprot:1340847-Amphidinium_carterae.1
MRSLRHRPLANAEFLLPSLQKQLVAAVAAASQAQTTVLVGAAAVLVQLLPFSLVPRARRSA